MKTTVNGTDIAYEQQGQGVPVILVHGFPFSRRMWSQQVSALARTSRVITVDLRGFGESGGTPESMDQLAGDINGVIGQLRLSGFVLAGFSMGGYVVFRYLARRFERPKALMLLDTRAEPDTPEEKERRMAGIERIRKEGPAGFLDDFAKLVVSSRTVETRPEIMTEVRRLMNGAKPESLIGGLRALAERPDSTPLLKEITMPTLVVVGEDDKATPVDSARKMAMTIPNAELVIIPGAGHVSNIEQPGAFNRALVDFLGKQKSV